MEITENENNLDYLCAKYGQEIPTTIDKNQKKKDIENLIRNSLGVLQEEGLFAFVVFLQSKEEKKESPIVKVILDKCKDLLKEIKILDDDERDIREIVLEITKDIDTMFLVKNIFEKCLIYSLYCTRALIK